MKRQANLVKPFQNLGLLKVAADQLLPHSDLTFKLLENLTIEGANVHQSLLNGCIIRNCTFRRVRFSRCDLEQAQFQQCRFSEVDFGNVEMTSSQIVESVFEKCNFESALISDCAWRNCLLENGNFEQAVIHNSIFENCRLKRNQLRGCSIQLDTFRQCDLESMKLGDCTFLNHILSGCKFKDIQINAESVGSLFGISEGDLLTFRLIYLGQSVVSINGSDDLLTTLEADYTTRRWFFMREVLRLNFSRTPQAIGLDACLSAVLWPASLGAPIKVNDIAFLEMIVLELSRLRQLPAMAAFTIPEQIRDFKLQNPSVGNERRDLLRLQELAGRLQMILLEMFEQLSVELSFLRTPKDSVVVATLFFSEKPSLDVPHFLQSVTQASGLPTKGKPKVIAEKSGSYVLVLETTLISLAALQIALWLLNGCVAQIIELKARLRLAVQKNLPKPIRERVLLTEQSTPKWMAVAVQGVFAKLIGNQSNLEGIASDLSPKNFQRIEISRRLPKKRSVAKTNS